MCTLPLTTQWKTNAADPKSLKSTRIKQSQKTTKMKVFYHENNLINSNLLLTEARRNTGTSSCASPGRGRGGRGSEAKWRGPPRCHGDDPFSRAVWWPGGRSSNSLHDLKLQFYDCVVSVCACLLFFSSPKAPDESFPRRPHPTIPRARRSDPIASHKTIIKEAIRVASWQRR